MIYEILTPDGEFIGYLEDGKYKRDIEGLEYDDELNIILQKDGKYYHLKDIQILLEEIDKEQRVVLEKKAKDRIEFYQSLIRFSEKKCYVLTNLYNKREIIFNGFGIQTTEYTQDIVRYNCVQSYGKTLVVLEELKND